MEVSDYFRKTVSYAEIEHVDCRLKLNRKINAPLNPTSKQQTHKLI